MLGGNNLSPALVGSRAPKPVSTEVAMSNSPAYSLSGTVQRATTHAAVGGVYVEAWDASGTFGERLAFGVTLDDGSFRLRVSEQDLRDAFVTDDEFASAEVFFRVATAGGASAAELLLDTEGRQSWSITQVPEAAIRLLVPETGETYTAEPWTVQGQVTDTDLGLLVGATVTAYDTRPQESDLELGNTTADEQGRYCISYDRADIFGGKERPDIRVHVEFEFETTSVDVYSDIRCHAPPRCRIDVVSSASGGTEYVRPESLSVSDDLRRALGVDPEDPLDLTTFDETDISRLTCTTGVSTGEVRVLWRAQTIAAETSSVVSADTVYGLLRHGLPDDRERLLTTPRAELRQALTRATTARTIALQASDIDTALDTLRDAAVDLAKETVSGTTCNLNDVLTLAIHPTSGDPQAARDAFLSAYMAHEGPIEDFWTSVDLDSATRSKAQLVLQWGLASQYFKPLLDVLDGSYSSASFASLAEKDEADWVTILDGISGTDDDRYPAGMPGVDGLDKKNNYAALLTRTMESAFPTRAIGGRVLKAAPSSDLVS